ncbi:DUF2125 domain-containing protein [Aquicoccus sp.]|uniref:DUF2125 domain-containing protein n=1 Tax=Aquicoccus sp. TaxID=2055851 RepID=UPI0035671787
MSNFRMLCGTTAMIGFTSGSVALADVTSDQVWNDWKNYFETFGYEVTATEVQEGDTLSVRDMRMTMPLPEDEGTVAITLGQVGFVDRGDGTVSVELPSPVPVVVDVEPDGEDPVKVSLDYSSSGFEMVAAGAPDEITYTYSADELRARLNEIIAEGEVKEIGTAELTIGDVRGSSLTRIGDVRELAQVMSTGAVAYMFDFVNPDDSDEFLNLTGGMDRMNFDGTATYPIEGGFDSEDVNAMLQAGFGFDGEFSYQGGRMDLEFDDGSDQLKAQTSTGSGVFAVGMSPSGLKYDVMSRGLTAAFEAADLPFPVDFAFEEIALKLLMPLQKSDEVQDFAMGLTLGDFTMSDMIWGRIDPEGELPRDPATIALDLSGRGKLAFDLFDPEEMEAVERGEIEMPGEIERLDLNRLEVTAAGASLTGEGGVDVDFPTVMMTQGMQGTEGTIQLRLTGANGLMDTLVGMGLVPEEQVMGARMMLSMFAVPGEGEDVLTSTIEVENDGQVLANGQRVK